MKISWLIGLFLLLQGCSGETSSIDVNIGRVNTWCDHGHRLYAHTKGLTVVPNDPSCVKQ